MYPKDAQSYHKGACLTMFIALLLIIARNWNQPRYPSTKEWIKNICTVKYYMAVKNNDKIKFAGKWME